MLPPEISQSLNTNVAVGIIVFACASIWGTGFYLLPTVKDWIVSRAAMHRSRTRWPPRLSTHTETTAATLAELRDRVVVPGLPGRRAPPRTVRRPVHPPPPLGSALNCRLNSTPVTCCFSTVATSIRGSSKFARAARPTSE